MVRWPDTELPAEIAHQLDLLQNAIDAAGNYATRVEQSKAAWGGKSHALFTQIRDVLAAMCSGAQRCAYCEDSAADEIEHIYPKDLYPERVFRWINYVFACGPCNGPKNAKFAVLVNGDLVLVTRPRGAPLVPPIDGETALLDPRIEEPMEYLSIDLETFWVLERTDLDHASLQRARFTIELLGLNRDYLLRARAEAFDNYSARLHQYVAYKNEGVSNDVLTLLSQRIKEMNHPAIWYEIKRSGHAQAQELGPLLAAAPELLD